MYEIALPRLVREHLLRVGPVLLPRKQDVGIGAALRRFLTKVLFDLGIALNPCVAVIHKNSAQFFFLFFSFLQGLLHRQLVCF